MTALALAFVLAYVNIPDTPQIADWLLGKEVTNSVSVQHKYVGQTRQDSLILTNAEANLYSHAPFNMQRHLKVLYGDMWRRQAKRALVERCERLVESVEGIIAQCDYDPRNLICRPPDCPLETYSSWSRRNQNLWYVVKSNVAQSEIHRYYHKDSSFFIYYCHELDSYNVCRWVVSPHTSQFGTNRGWYARDSGLQYYYFIDKFGDDVNGAMNYLLDSRNRINPIYYPQIRNDFAKRRSFSLPFYGSYIFDTATVFEEFSHQLNVGILKTEWRQIYDVIGPNFPGNLNYHTKWSEFIVSMAGVKQDAFDRYGIDIGQQGGFANYYARVKPELNSSSGRAAYMENISDATLAVVLAYQWAVSVERAQTAYGNPIPPDVARFLSWCRDPAIGRMVL